MALIAEDLLLLLLDDSTGELRAPSSVQVALGGAVLAELAIAGSVEVGARSGMWRTAKVHPSGAPPADPVLTEAHALVAEKERSATDLVSRLGKGLQDRLIADLVSRGVLEERKDRALGLFPRTRWPAADSTHEDDVRRQLAATLLQAQPPSPHTGALVSLLSATDQVHQVIPHDGLTNGELKKRAEEVAAGDWAAKSVSDAIAAANAAIMAAVVASTSAATTSLN